MKCFEKFELLIGNPTEEEVADGDSAHINNLTKHNESKFKDLVHSIFQHCNDSLAQEMEDAYDVPKYPIHERQHKQNMIRQMSKLV